MASLDDKPNENNNILSASIHSIKGVVIHKDNRNRVNFNKPAPSFITHEINSTKFNEIARIYNVSSILEFGCCKSNLSEKISNILYYCGVDTNLIPLNNINRKISKSNFNFICSPYNELKCKDNIYDLIYISDEIFGGETNTQDNIDVILHYTTRFNTKYIACSQNSINLNIDLIHHLKKINFVDSTLAGQQDIWLKVP